MGGGQDKPAWTACPPGVKITRVGGKITPDSLPPGGGGQAVQGGQDKLLVDLCQTDWIFFAGQNKKIAGQKKILRVGLSTNFNHQFAKIYSESKENENEITVSNVSLYLLLFLFSRKFCQIKVTVNGNNEWFPLVRPYWIRSFRPFWICSKYLKETIKDCYNYGKKLALTFLNVTMDTYYKTFSYFAKQKDNRINNNLEKRLLIWNLVVKTCLWPKTVHTTLI